MTLLFDRKYSLVIGNPTLTKDFSNANPYSENNPLKEGSFRVIESTSTDWRSTLANGVEITDLQIEADIKGNANNSSNATDCVIKIYNLSPRTRAIIEANNNYVILRAGYAQDEELRIVFVGQVQDFDTTKQGKDLVTTLNCVDGQLPINSVRVSKSFGGVTYKEVFEYLISVYEENGIARGDLVSSYIEEPQNYVQLPVIKGQPLNYLFKTGYTVMGFLHQAMDTLCKEIGYVNYITNGKIFVHPKGYTATVEQFEFSSNQMKSIRKFGSTATETSINGGVNGVKIITFLDGRLDIDKRIKVLDGEHEGTYKIVTKSHKLNYESGEWTTEITCDQLKVGQGS